jgi:hypothetical protein
MSSEQARPESEVLVDSLEGTMDYVQYVESHNFGEYKKYALDLALLLNNPDLAVTGDEYARRSKADIKTIVFNHFCSVCVKSGVEIPPLSQDLFMPFVPEDFNSSEIRSRTEQVLEIKKGVDDQTGQLEDIEVKKQIDTLTEFMLLFAEKFDADSGFRGVSTNEIIALLNKKLIEKGLKPVRPDYSKLDLKTRVKEEAPKRPIKLLIVDDDFKEVVNSILGVAGWPNVNIEYLYCERDYNDKSSKETKVSLLADKIFACSPDVILMDQGLDMNVNGSEVLKTINSDPRSVNIKAVANTGGNDEELRAQGAHSNFQKGHGKMDGIRRAVRSIS